VSAPSNSAGRCSNNRRQGTLFIISAPSGAGKTTLCNIMRQRFPGLRYSISSTTRPPRTTETEGVDYFFITQTQFEEGITQGRWAEWAKVHDHYYGTRADVLNQALAAGHDLLLDIDVQGARQLMRRFPQAVTIFIRPPSLAALRQRLEQRASDSAAAIAKRLKNAQTEMAGQSFYRHVVVNDDLERAVEELATIIEDHVQAPSR